MSTASSPSGFDESFPEDDLELPDDLREEVAKPIGRMTRGIHCWIGMSCIRMPMSYILRT